MKYLIGTDIGSYAFDVASKTVTFAGVAFSQEQLVVVVNATRGVVLYDFSDASKRGALVGSVLTLETDLVGMQNTDALSCWIVTGDAPPLPAGAATEVASQGILGAVLGGFSGLIERMAVKALAKLTFSTAGLRVDGSTVTLTVAPSTSAPFYTNVGNMMLSGTSISQTQNNFQTGFRRNLTVT